MTIREGVTASDDMEMGLMGATVRDTPGQRAHSAHSLFSNFCPKVGPNPTQYRDAIVSGSSGNE